MKSVLEALEEAWSWKKELLASYERALDRAETQVISAKNGIAQTQTELLEFEEAHKRLQVP